MWAPASQMRRCTTRCPHSMLGLASQLPLLWDGVVLNTKSAGEPISGEAVRLPFLIIGLSIDRLRQRRGWAILPAAGAVVPPRRSPGTILGKLMLTTLPPIGTIRITTHSTLIERLKLALILLIALSQG